MKRSSIYEPILAGILLFAPLSACNASPARPEHIARGDYQPVIRYLSATIKHDLKKYNTKAVSIALVDGQKLVWAAGFGESDATRHVPATADTLYHVGSVTKVFTATEIMRLAQEKRVGLDRRVNRYIPEFSIHNRFAHSKPITIRALLAHHSGMPSDTLRGMWVKQPVSLADYVDSLRDQSLASPPQTLYKYSNIDFSILGRVIEKVDRETYANAMEHNLLAPLGMMDSSFRLAPDARKRLAVGYRKGKAVPPLNLRDVPAGGLVSSVNDMSRFVRFLLAGGRANGRQILRRNTLREMFTQQFPGLPLDFGHKIGLAWMLSGLSIAQGPSLVWHNGGYPPYVAHVSLLPRQQLGVVILSNTAESSKFVTQLGVETLELAYQAKFGVAPPAKTATTTAAKVHIPRERLAHDTGYYALFSGEPGRVTLHGDRLRISMMGHDFNLDPIGPDRFQPSARLFFGLVSIPVKTLSLRFETVQDHDFAVLYGLPAPFAFERLHPGNIPVAWRKRTGSCSADTRGETFDFKSAVLADDTGILIFHLELQPKTGDRHPNKADLALVPISANAAVVAGVGMGEGGLVRAVDSGDHTVLRYSGFRFDCAAVRRTATR